MERDRLVESWTEHFEAEFNWSPETPQFFSTWSEPEWNADVGPPTFLEIEKAVWNLKRCKVTAGPDSLPPEVFKDGGKKLLIRVTEVLNSVWESEGVPLDWSTSLIIPVFMLFVNGEKSSDDRSGVSLTIIVFKILESIVIQRRTAAQEKSAGFRQSWTRVHRSYIDHTTDCRTQAHLPTKDQHLSYVLT
ncbi:unnamed protein product [Heterobilharzia americana]|nr:unnamed protein product [Heterobilharzia americana]